MKLKWVTNAHESNIRFSHESLEHNFAYVTIINNGNDLYIVGMPNPTEYKSVGELMANGLVGLYKEQENG